MANDKDFKIKNGLQLGGAFIEKVGTIAGNATLDLSTGNVFDYTPTDNATFAFSNAGETEHSFVLSVVGAEVGASVSSASYLQSFSVSSQENVPYGIFIRPDGTKMYIVGESGDDVNEYDLSTAWDISTASYVQNFSVAAQDTTPTDVFFKTDGTKMYVLGLSGDDVNEYNLSTPWDISTATYLQNFSIASQEGSPFGMHIKPDGTKIYILGFSDNVNEYNLSTPWDISTASFIQNFSVAAQDRQAGGIYITEDGTSLYISGISSDSIYEYYLSTAWDISTASFVDGFSVAAQSTGPLGLFFKPDISKFYVVDFINKGVFEYNMPAQDPATLTYPASVYWPSGTVPDAPAVGETDILEFNTTNGGTVWYGTKAGDAMA